MQIIQKIRDKGAAIVIGVIALSLIGFILMDANLGMQNSAAGDMVKAGEVNGMEISRKEVSDKGKMISAQMAQYGQTPNANQVENQAWDQIVLEKVLTAEFEKSGIVFTPKELQTVLFSAEDAPQILKQYFSDPKTGTYDLTKVQQFWQNAKKAKGEEKESIEAQIIEPAKLQSMYTKYSSMLAASVYYPSWMKEKETAEAKTFANISYVAVPYSTISDSTIKVTDEDINSYVSKRKALYKQEAGRAIAYVGFSTNANGADTAATRDAVAVLKDAFVADSNAKSFVTNNMSSIKFEDVYAPKSKLPAQFKDTLVSLATGTVYGPYLDGSDFVLAKMIGVKILPDSIKCRHILIATTDRQTGQQIMTDSAAKKRIDSIEMAINAGTSFDVLEPVYSSDEAAKKDKGVMTFDIATIQNKQNFAPEFGEFLLNEKGETRKTVKTNFGWHYIEILEKKNPAPAYKIAYMAKEILASQETIDAASAKASKLTAEARDLKAFDAYVEKNKLQKIETPPVKISDYALNSLPDARQVITWAYGAKVGDVSDPMSTGDQFVVAVLTKIQPEGLPDAKTIRPQVEYLVRNAKKAEQIKAKLTATPTLQSASAAYNIPVATAGADSTLTFSASSINGIGGEPKVIGAAFNKNNATKESAPIEGVNGVYVIKVNSTGTKPADTAEEAAAKEKQRLTSLSQQLGGWMEALKKQADIKDARFAKD